MSNRSYYLFSTIFIVLGLLFLGRQSEQPHLSEPMELFYDMATLPEDCIAENTDRCIRRDAFLRWEHDINFGVLGYGDRETQVPVAEEIVWQFSERLSEYTSIQFYEEVGGLDIVVLLLDDHLEAELRNGTIPSPLISGMLDFVVERPEHCSVDTIGRSEISFAWIYVGENVSGAELQRCIFEELFNAMGLFSDPNGLPSLLDHPWNTDLPPEDPISGEFWSLVSILYALEDLSAQNFIENASRFEAQLGPEPTQ